MNTLYNLIRESNIPSKYDFRIEKTRVGFHLIFPNDWLYIRVDYLGESIESSIKKLQEIIQWIESIYVHENNELSLF